MSESASESTSESESVSVSESESESTSESSSISESAKQSDAEQQSGDNVVAAAYTDDAEQDTAVYARMSGMPQLASNDTYRDGCVSDQVHHVTKITARNFKDLARSDVQSINDVKPKKWKDKNFQYRVKNSNTGEWEYFNNFDQVTFNWKEGIFWWETSHNKTGELYICDGNAFVLKVRSLSDKEPASTNELESAADSLIAAITISAPWIELTPPMAIPAAVIPFKILSTFFLFI